MPHGDHRIPPAAKALAAVLLSVFVLQASSAARRDSVTIDEYEHLPVGLYVLYTHDYSLDPINPPLVGMIAALPLLRSAPAFETDASWGHWGLGYTLMRLNVGEYQEIFVRGRTMIVLLSALLGCLVFAWANRLYGWRSALVAVGLFSFSPSMLAHGHLVTLDAPGALGFAATVWAAWWLLDRPGIARAALLGLALGVANLLKLSAFILALVIVAVVVIRIVTERGEDRVPISRWLLLLIVTGLVSLFVLNAGYEFQGTLAPLSEAALAEGGMLAGIRDALPWLRLPLPLPFVDGVDMVLNVGKGHEPSYFLAGELSSEGWWYYHLAAFAFKTPIPLLIAGAIAMGQWIFGRRRGSREYCLFVTVIVVFAANSLFNSLYIGVRHVLPVYPVLFIAVSPLFANAFQRAASTGRRSVDLAAAGCVAALLLWFATASVLTAPRYLEYFNEAAGGRENGHELLVDSNIDWGQDLLRLKDYIDAEGITRINLAYFGRVHPAVYGIPFVPLEGPADRGVTAVSASFLMGRPYFWYRGGRLGWVKSNTYTWLQEREPVARVGSMFIYDL